jgi:hypothetical protein
VTYAQEVAAIRDALRKVAETCPPELREQARRAAQVEVARIRKQPAPPSAPGLEHPPTYERRVEQRVREVLDTPFPELVRQAAPPSAPLADRLEKMACYLSAVRRDFASAELCFEAAAALRAAEQDTARLDWLEANPDVEITTDVAPFVWRIDKGGRNVQRPTLRAALDAARKEAGNER